MNIVNLNKMNTIKTNQHWHPNTSIEFNSNGMWLRVSLNIETTLVRYLSPNNVKKGKHRLVYCLRNFIESDMICKDNLEKIHTMLLNNCMRNIRKAKEKRNHDKVRSN